MARAFLFSGQGSQYVGMGQDLCANEHAAVVFRKADEILGYSLSTICWNGPVETLRETRYTQPALFVHEVAVLAALQQRVQADAVAGHSLGEYSALYCAGVLSFEEALKLVALRGELMFQAGLEQPGTMAAVVGLADEKVEELCATISAGIVVPANYNSPGQVVISGDAEPLRAALPLFKDAGARMVTELQVSGAFHSPLMQPAKETLAKALHAASFHDANIDVYTNVDARAHREAGLLREQLIAQLVSPVRWTQTLNAMKASGVDDFVEIGPGKVLQGLVKRSLQDVRMSGFDKMSDFAALSEN